MAQKNNYREFEYEDPTGIIKTLRIALVCYIIAYVLDALGSGLDIFLLLGAESVATYESENLIAHGIVGALAFLLLGVLVVTSIIFLRWQNKATTNLFALGKSGMKIRPGWSIGWYFIPFASLIKPYQAMKEIWFGYQLDEMAFDANEHEAPSIMRWWWGLWLLSRGLDNTARSFSEDSIQSLINLNIFYIAQSVFFVILTVVVIRMLDSIQKNQLWWHEQLMDRLNVPEKTIGSW